VFLVLILGFTGILEVFYYIPTPSEAALSIQTLAFLVPYGDLVRNLHFWAAQFLVVVSFVHLIRVVFTGAYFPRRRFNYLLGMALFVLAVLLDFTGYVLRWDEGIRWALVTGLLISIYSSIDKVGVRYVDPLPYLYLFLVVTWLALSAQWLNRDRRSALRVSNDIQRRWRSFSHSGTPGDDWPAYTSADRAVMVFDKRSRVELDPHPHRRTAWEGFSLISR